MARIKSTYDRATGQFVEHPIASDAETVASEVATQDVIEADRLAQQRRRAGKGSRTMADFFAPERQLKAVTRAELLNILSMVEYARRENTTWRRFWRWVRKYPQPAFSPALLANAHARVLEKTRADMEAAERLRYVPEDKRGA